MTKVAMPDPMVEVNKNIVSPELQYTYLAPDAGLEHGTCLITTEQAEAYANARVKQALEEAADIADQNNAFSVYDAICSLIPKGGEL